MNNLKEYRTKAGLTQLQLAVAVGMSLRQLQCIEQGQRSLEGAAALTVLKMSYVLGCTVEDLLVTSENQKELENIKNGATSAPKADIISRELFEAVRMHKAQQPKQAQVNTTLISDIVHSQKPLPPGYKYNSDGEIVIDRAVADKILAALAEAEMMDNTHSDTL